LIVRQCCLAHSPTIVKLRNAIVLIWLGLLLSGVGIAQQPAVLVLPLSGAITPASADFLGRGLARAESEHAQLLVLQLDTPGGLDTSMRDMIKLILASPVPVATFVAPSGARAASAGTYILYASHIAAMAPGTTLGAASPVQIGIGTPGKPEPVPLPKPAPGQAGKELPGDTQSTLGRKQMHDAAAYIRGLAQLRGRNAEWAERAVREAVSLSADEALAQKVIDLTARDVPQLLTRLDRRKLSSAGGEQVLHTANAPVVTLAPDWKNRLLSVITEPSVALLLMMAGIYGLFFEFFSPGFVLPGVVGAICLLLGLFSLHLLPVNFAGLALLLLGLSFMLADTFLGSFVLGIGGVVAFAIGAVMLIDTDLPGFGIPLPFIAGLSLATAAFFLLIGNFALKSRKRPLVSGQGELPDSSGEVLEDLQTEGWALVHSERWWIRSPVPLKRGQRVRVTGRNGLVLDVVPLDAAASRHQGE
jgi:membrane-bound serine protease (ClpP class)